MLKVGIESVSKRSESVLRSTSLTSHNFCFSMISRTQGNVARGLHVPHILDTSVLSREDAVFDGGQFVEHSLLLRAGCQRGLNSVRSFLANEVTYVDTKQSS